MCVCESCHPIQQDHKRKTALNVWAIPAIFQGTCSEGGGCCSSDLRFRLSFIFHISCFVLIFLVCSQTFRSCFPKPPFLVSYAQLPTLCFLPSFLAHSLLLTCILTPPPPPPFICHSFLITLSCRFISIQSKKMALGLICRSRRRQNGGRHQRSRRCHQPPKPR